MATTSTGAQAPSTSGNPTSAPASSPSPGGTHSQRPPADNSSTRAAPQKPRLYLKPAPWFGYFQLPKAVQSTPYEPQKITVSNGTGPYTFAIGTDLDLGKLFDQSQILPPGLKLSPDGTISGTPTQGGTYQFKVEATDANGTEGACYYTIAVELDLNHYNAYFDGQPNGPAAGGTTEICRFDASPASIDGKPRYPLSLCEFLAYKAAQAYVDDDPKKPDKGLRALLKKAHPDDEIKHYQFFDSTTPLTYYTAEEIQELENEKAKLLLAGKEPSRDKKLEELERKLAAKAPGRWKDFDKKQIDKLNKRRKVLDTQAFGFVFEGRAFIVCRGTSSLQDGLVDIDNGLTTDAPEQKTRLQSLKYAVGLGNKNVRMTEEERILIGGPDPDAYLKPARAVGFAAAWASIRDQVENWLETVPAKFRQEFVFSGHSLGGALAFVGAQEFAEKRQRRIHAVITFGAPCVGMSEKTAGDRPAPYFVDSYHQLQNGELEHRTIRLESSSDAVPKLMRVKNFDHVGRQWQVEFRPLPVTSTLLRRKFVSGPLLYLAKSSLRSSASSFSALPRKALGYAILYGLPFVNKVLAAHSADSRYALFLSTLAYRKIRSAHIGDLANLDPKNDKTLDEKYLAANKKFEDHLGLILGKISREVKKPRIIECPKTELSYSKKYYGRAKAEYIF